jgi:hypothetical protein
MKGDFSRIRFSAARHYTAVLQQQGRVALDADHNEQAAIEAYLRGTELTDVVGPFGGPRAGGGFRIAVADGTILIGRGRYYVQGLLCENERVLRYDDQPYLLNPAARAADLLAGLQDGTWTTVQVFLEVWQRLVTALDDPCLREPALGQADTTDRVQTVWRVVAEGTAPPQQVAGATSAGTGFTRGATNLSGIVAKRFVARQTFSGASSLGAGVIGRTQPGQVAERGPVSAGAAGAPSLLSPCCLEMYRSALGTKAGGGRLGAQTTGGGGDCTCEPTPPAGYRGLENQLYRVEIHQGGDETAATFKWSRENGSVVSAVTGVFGANLTVDSLGPDPYLGFSPNQWVELTDDTNVFGPAPNQPGALMQVQSTSPEELTITLAQTAPSLDTTRNARVRRWDQFGQTAAPGGIPLAAGTWLGLENGIQIQFTQGQYAPGDYWLIPARTASGQIDWPPCDGDGALFQPAQRTVVYRAPLACLHWDSKAGQIVPDDCRLLFSPLIDLAVQTPPALHVTKISWSNDDVMTLDQLVANGLVVTLDRAAAGPIDASTFTVALEYAHPVKEGYARGAALTLQRVADILDSRVTVSGPTITWQLPAAGTSFTQLETLEEIQTGLLAAARFSLFARTRVRLLGHMIYGSESVSAIAGERIATSALARAGSNVGSVGFGGGGTGGTAVASGGAVAYLDGQAFGAQGTRADGSPRIDLALPSGALAKASDFESWFYLAPQLDITNVAIQPAAVTVVPSGVVIATPAATWAAKTRVTAGTQILGPVQQVLQATKTGTSGQTQPSWPAAIGATVQDGSVTWQVVAPAAVSPQGTITFSYPPVAQTPIGLFVSGGTAGIVTVSQSVPAAAGQTIATFPVTVAGNPGPSTQTYTITATLTPAIGNAVSMQAQLSVAGFAQSA